MHCETRHYFSVHSVHFVSTLFALRVWNRKFQWGTSGPGKAFRTGANLCKGVQRCAERRNELAYDQDVQCVLNVSIPWPGAKLCNRCLLGLWPCSWSSDAGDSRLHFFHPILFVREMLTLIEQLQQLIIPGQPSCSSVSAEFSTALEALESASLDLRSNLLLLLWASSSWRVALGCSLLKNPLGITSTEWYNLGIAERSLCFYTALIAQVGVQIISQVGKAIYLIDFLVTEGVSTL